MKMNGETRETNTGIGNIPIVDCNGGFIFPYVS